METRNLNVYIENIQIIYWNTKKKKTFEKYPNVHCIFMVVIIHIYRRIKKKSTFIVVYMKFSHGKITKRKTKNDYFLNV